MLWEATITMLMLMFGMWAMAVWASFKEDSNREVNAISQERKQAA